jgi:hypothetical protein
VKTRAERVQTLTAGMPGAPLACATAARDSSLVFLQGSGPVWDIYREDSLEVIKV